MPIDPIKIPQNVYIEDRIIGPVTLRQIIITGIGAGISYGLFATLSKATGGLGIVGTVLVWIPAVIGAAFSFVQVNDLNLFRICLLLLEKFTKSPIRTWSPRQGLMIHIRAFATAEEQTAKKPVPHKELAPLEGLSSTLDQGWNTAEEETPPSEPIPSAPRPVDRTRISASPVVSASPTGTDAAPAPMSTTPAIPPHAASSIFRDLSPR